MIRNELSITIDRPADDVFAHMTHLRNLPSFNSVLGKLDHAEEKRVSVGAQFTLDTAVGGDVKPVTFEVTQYDPPKAFAFKSMSPGTMPVTYTYLFEAIGNRTRLYYVEELDPGNLTDQARLKDIERMRHSRLESDLRHLKESLEA